MERSPDDVQWSVWQTTEHQLKNTIWTLQTIIADKHKQSEEATDLNNVLAAIIVQLTYVKSPSALISLLKLLQFVFTHGCALSQKIAFAEQGGFEVLIKTMVTTDTTCQDLILSFMAKQFQSGHSEEKDLVAAYTDGSKKVKTSFNQFVK